MKRTALLLVCLLLPLAASYAADENSASAQGGDPEEIIRKADAVRNPGESYLLKIIVDSTESPNEPSEFHVAIQGKDKTRIETVMPRRDAGRSMLMLNENMWLFIPNLHREVRVSLNHKLTGQAANGDISRMRWSGDYTPVVEMKLDKEWQLLLTANKKGLTYDKVRVWIERGSYRPLRAEYLTSSGKILKRASFQGYKEIAGGVRPTEIIIEDAVRKNDKSVIKIEEMRVKDFPAFLFNKSALDRRHLE